MVSGSSYGATAEAYKRLEKKEKRGYIMFAKGRSLTNCAEDVAGSIRAAMSILKVMATS